LATNAIGPMLDFLRNISEPSDLPSRGIAAKFAALSKKFGGNFMKPNLSVGTKISSGLDCIDLRDKTTSIKISKTTVIFVSLADKSPRAVWHDVLSSVKTHEAGMTKPIAVFILANHQTLQSYAKWVAHMRSPGFVFVVVPSSQLVWYCKFREKSSLVGCARALVHASIQLKMDGKPFPKVAKHWDRVCELAIGDTLGAKGGGKSRMDHLFARTDPKVRAQIQMDATATFSVTDEVTADEITKKCLSLPNVTMANTALVDLTACVGGNTSSFAKRFEVVVGVEINDERFAMLRHNTRLLGFKEGEGMHLVRGDCLSLLRAKSRTILPNLSNYIFFVDPPWGGLNYKDQATVTLKLGGEPIEAVIRACFNVDRCAHVVIKCPFNVNMTGLHALEAEGTIALSCTWSLSKRVKCLVFSHSKGLILRPKPSAAAVLNNTHVSPKFGGEGQGKGSRKWGGRFKTRGEKNARKKARATESAWHK
jgi:hypothetical protein